MVVILPWFPTRISGYSQLRQDRTLLVIGNHQSFFDPVFIGLTMIRRHVYLARESLFRNPVFKFLIQTLNAIPIRRDGLGKDGLQLAAQKLAQGNSLLIFPEGTRTETGKVQPVKPGVLLLIRRVQSPLMISGIAGLFESWPRRQRFPKPGPVWVHFARVDELSPGNSADQTAQLQRLLEAACEQASARRSAWLRNYQ